MKLSHITRKHLAAASPAALAFGILAFSSAPALAACTLTGTLSTWALAASGDWNTAGHWNPSGVPNSSSTNVCIVDGVSTVGLDVSASVASLQLASGNGLAVNSGETLNINGPLMAERRSLHPRRLIGRCRRQSRQTRDALRRRHGHLERPPTPSCAAAASP